VTPILPPMGWTVFALGAPRAADLAAVNARVNARIMARDADAAKPWRIVYGDEAYVERDGCCHDYAVTKRAELLGLGWPASRLLLAEVAYDAAEDHMILVAVADDGGQLVLDNLRPDIVTWEQAGYRLVRWQSQASPDQWVA
jgi:predicted transglutaminase-like cysteine proteinase